MLFGVPDRPTDVLELFKFHWSDFPWVKHGDVTRVIGVSEPSEFMFGL
jgi:hypothetical protein